MAGGARHAPFGVRMGAGLVLAGVALLFLHNTFRAPWPPVPPGRWWNWLYYAIEVAATGLCATRCALWRGERAAWLGLTLGMALYTAGDLYWALVFGVNASNVPVPSPADALYLSYFPAVYVGLALLLRARIGSLPAGLWLDGLSGALAVAALGATLVLGPVLSATHGAPLAVATNLAYPLGDLLLLGIIAGVIALTGWRGGGGWWLIALGLGIFAVTDSIYLVQSAQGAYVPNGLLDVGWPAAISVVALAAWRPAAAHRAVRIDGWAAFLVPTVAALTCLSLVAYDHFARIGLIADLLAVACLLSVIARLAMTFAENLRMLRTSRTEAVTDALTGLSNRRALELELHRRLAERPTDPFVLAFYDLDGFKAYNDTFGHQAGDALLARLGARAAATAPGATLFRMGGDEFCLVVAEAGGGQVVAARAAAALSETGGNFAVGCSYGVVRVPQEATDPESAMLLADARMYEHKGGRRASAAVESQEVLLRAQAERNHQLGKHNRDVAALVDAVAEQLGLGREERVALCRAAELHDVGKLAIPDTILDKPGPLDEAEWDFMRRHTLVGERIVASATSLRDVAPMVRSSHERWDGHGYPDALAGEQIPLGARIIAVCDAFDAMITARSYKPAIGERAALGELVRCAGTQFDPRVVAAFVQALSGTAGARAWARAA